MKVAFNSVEDRVKLLRNKLQEKAVWRLGEGVPSPRYNFKVEGSKKVVLAELN